MLNQNKGNEQVKETLTHLIESGRFPHCILLTGQAAIDKMALAREIAAALVCKNKGCGQCKDCLQTLNGNHQDVILVEKDPDKTEFTVDKVRFVSGDMNIAPGSADCKVYLLKDVHLLNTQAQNALLKSLEEPAKNVFFILTALSQTLLLETIRSRAMTFSLQEETTEEGSELLVKENFNKDYLALLTQGLPSLQVWLLEEDQAKLKLIENLLLGAFLKRRDLLLVQLRKLFSYKDKEEIKQLLLMAQTLLKLCVEYKTLGGEIPLPNELKEESNKVSRSMLLTLFDKLGELIEVLPIHFNNSIAEVHFASYFTV